MGLVDEQLSRGEKSNIEAVKGVLRQEFLRIFNQNDMGLATALKLEAKPTVIMVVGVNGAGKTTSIGKLSAQLAKSGKRVLVAAGDTFRAAAGNQLKVWTERAQVDIYSPENISDPSAVAFEAIQRGLAKAYDVVIVDTAGRLHTQVNLMEELKKMKRVISKAIPGAPHEVLIVLDANSGQNALFQAREFNSALQLTGVVLTKMDGTAKGGVAVGLVDELKVPIRFIGIGEKIGDLQPFSPAEFIDSIL
jgi:fused signal recognition particle receptor